METLDVLKTVIKKAGREVLKYYGREVNTVYKSGHSPVTDADLASQKVIFEGLKDFGWPMFSEEAVGDGARLKNKLVWIIDPLDGTKDFLQKTGEFSVMVGLVREGRPILGAVYQPTEDTLYYAEKGKGAYKQEGNADPQKIMVFPRKNPAEAVLLVSRNHLRPAEIKLAERLGIKNVKPCGSVGVKVGLIADGRADIYIVSGNFTGEWDTCAPDIIIHEAGGRMTDMNGEALIYNKGLPENSNGIVVTNGILHSLVVEKLAKISRS